MRGEAVIVTSLCCTDPRRNHGQVCRCFSGCYLLSLLSTYGIGGDDVTLRVSRIDWTIGFLIHVSPVCITNPSVWC